MAQPRMFVPQRKKAMPPAEAADQRWFEVFTRNSPEDTLSHAGSVAAPNLSLAKAHARWLFAERPWVEECIAPRDAFVSLTSSAARVGVV
jgi:hypothetical protein